MVPKKYIYVSVLIFAFNFFVSVKVLDHAKIDSTVWAFIYASVPLWGCIMIGSVLGFVIMPFLDKKLNSQQKYILSKVYGIMVANAIFLVYYIYKLMEWNMLHPN